MAETTTTDPATRPVKLDTEYVVGGGFWWYRGQAARARTLPWAFDDVTRDFGDDLYETMLHDAQIAACDALLRAGILEDGITLSPAIDEIGADGYEQATELVAFCEPQLDDLETALDAVLWDMLACLSMGNRIAEITYHPMDRSPLPGRAVLRSLTVKPRRATAFVVDPYLRVIGVMGRQASSPTAAMTGMLIEPDDERVLDREKFAIATFRPVDNDPRGSSDLRPAYHPWWLKMQTWLEFLKYLAQFASPSIVGTTAENAKPEIDPMTGTTVGPVAALLAKLLAFQNGSALVLPFGANIELLFSRGEGEAFFRAFQLYDQQITKAITTQTLAASEAEFGTRAQASVHQDALGTIVRQAKRAICRTLRRDVLRNLVRYNYGDKLAALTPIVSLGEVTQEDAAKLISAFAQIGLTLDPSQYAGVDRRLNLPPRVAAEPHPAPEPGKQGQQGGTANEQ